MTEINFSAELDQNWKSYRTWLNEQVAVISVNMALMDIFPADKQAKLAYVVRGYESDESGLPFVDCADEVFRHILHSVAQLGALPDVLYAGHILSGGKVQQLFYFSDETAFAETLSQLEYDDLIVQQDAHWDTYFEFLLPSSLESKMTLTEEILDTLVENGVDLSSPKLVEHSFHFNEKEEVERFIEKCSLSDVQFNHIKYTENPVQTDDSSDVYLVKIEQEMSLDTQDIFNQVERFEQLADAFSAQYLGWEYGSFGQRGNYLN
ncbi:hypothetical protein A4G18_09900 [Pasteurellaceae bacterium Pebbles2]|nr:hypothetical protein [Pasteurellaceae bacterium Pebbles2]